MWCAPIFFWALFGPLEMEGDYIIKKRRTFDGSFRGSPVRCRRIVCICDGGAIGASWSCCHLPLAKGTTQCVFIHASSLLFVQPCSVLRFCYCRSLVMHPVFTDYPTSCRSKNWNLNNVRIQNAYSLRKSTRKEKTPIPSILWKSSWRNVSFTSGECSSYGNLYAILAKKMGESVFPNVHALHIPQPSRV